MRHRNTSLLTFLATAALCAQQGQVGAGGQAGGVGPGGRPAQTGQNSVEQPPPAPPDPKELCSIEGRITDSVSNQGLNNTTVNLTPMSSGPAGVASQTSTATVTDAEGKFVLKGIVAGTYRLSATHAGYLAAQYGARRAGAAGTPITLTASQKMTNVMLRMRKHAVIGGRVIDEFGDPVERAQVQAMRYQYVNRERRLTTAGSANTDDLGNFRIFGLAPDRYYIRASSTSSAMMSLTGDGAQFVYLPVFYPNATEERSASPLAVDAGAQMTGLNFTLMRSKAFSIQGQVLNQTGLTGTIMVMLRSRTGVDFLPGASRFSGVNGSKFDIRGVSPGSYTLMSAMSDRGTSYSGRLDLDIADRDLTGIALPLNPGLDLPGEIVVEDNAQIDLTTLRVSLQGTNTSSLMTGAGTAGGGPSQFTFGTQASDKVGADGKFTLHNLFPDASRPTITPLPNGFYVKSIKFGEQEVLESGLDLSRGAGAALKITLSGQAGNITGTVNGDDGNPFSGATVVLIPKSDARRAVSQFYRNASSNQQGQFTFRNLDPGDYKIYAWEDVENSAWMDPEFVKPYESKATEVTLAPAGQQQLQLKTIPPPK